MKTAFKLQDIVDAFERAGYDVQSYSGRAMYGDECLAVVANNVLSVVPNVISEFAKYHGDENYMVDANLVSEFCDLFNDARTDSMGLQSVIYFPKIEWDDNELVETDEDYEEE